MNNKLLLFVSVLGLLLWSCTFTPVEDSQYQDSNGVYIVFFNDTGGLAEDTMPFKVFVHLESKDSLEIEFIDKSQMQDTIFSWGMFSTFQKPNLGYVPLVAYLPFHPEYHRSTYALIDPSGMIPNDTISFSNYYDRPLFEEDKFHVEMREPSVHNNTIAPSAYFSPIWIDPISIYAIPFDI